MNEVPLLVKVAGTSPEALRAQALRLADFLAASEPVDLAAVAWTACVGRADLSERAAVPARSIPELRDGLRAVAAKTSAGRRHPGLTPRVAFLAPGHGAAVAGTLADVYGRVPVVTDTLDALAEVVG